MRPTYLLILVFVLVISGRSQTGGTTLLTGTVYDANGAVIVNAIVNAKDQKKQKFETRTNGDGVYKIKLPFNPYVSSDRKFIVAKYEVSVIAEYFEKSILNDFKVVPGKMQLDVALDVLESEDLFEVEDKNSNKNRNKIKSQED